MGLFFRPRRPLLRLAAGADQATQASPPAASAPTDTIAEFEGDRIRRFRQYWNEVELLDELGLLPL